MRRSFLIFLAITVALSSLVASSPTPPFLDFLPLSHPATAMAFDEAEKQFIAYKGDGSIYGVIPSSAAAGHTEGVSQRNRRQSTSNSSVSCTQMTVQQAQTMPGWGNFTQAATNQWGDGSYTLATNDPDYPQYPATACLSAEPAALTADGPPTCANVTSTAQGEFTGASGNVTVQIATGTSTSASYTVTKSSSIAESVEFTASFSVFGIGAAVSSTTTGTFTNENGQTFTTAQSSTETTTVQVSVANGKTCNVQVFTETCTAQVDGQLRTSALGWIWFRFDKKVQGHRYWGLSIENTLLNIDDRSSWIEISGSSATQSNTGYHPVCM